MAVTPISSVLSADQHRYAVESNIPIAPRNAATQKYTFGLMEIGNSFRFDGIDIERVRQSAYAWSRLHPPMKFSVSARHLRCWRVA